MNYGAPEIQFEKIKRLQRVVAFAPMISFTFVAAVLILESLPPDPYDSLHAALPLHFIDWLYFSILLLLVATLVPVILLVAQPALRKIHLAVRLDVIYGYILYAWLVFFASRLLVSIYHGIYWFPEAVLHNLLLGVLIKSAFLLIKRKYSEKPETMFP